MKLFVVLLLFLLSGCAASTPRLDPEAVVPLPQLAGMIRGERVIRGEVVLAADLRIPYGSRLVAEPGTTIYVLPADSTKIDPERLSSLTELQVEGELLLRGSAAQPVRILPLKAADPVPESDPLWAGIDIMPGGRAELNHVYLARAEHGVRLFGGQALLQSSRFARNRYGVMLQGEGGLKAADLQLLRGEVGLFCWGGSLTLNDSLVGGNDEEGLLLGDDCKVELGRNRIESNAIGLVSRMDYRFGQELKENRIDWQVPGEVSP